MQNEEQVIQDHLKQKGLTAGKTPSGLHYVITNQGDGAKVEARKKVKVNYTGKLLNGNVFDSSVEAKFGHVEPIEFTVGVGQVIKGWDEGLQLFNVGGKGTLFIPSSLGYGIRGAGASIPPNSILVFDVEVVGQK